MIPTDIIGKQVQHKSFGLGTITGISGPTIEIFFKAAGVKEMGYEFCIKKKLIEFI